MIGNNSGLAKVIKVPISPFATALLALVGNPMHLLVDCDRTTSLG